MKHIIQFGILFISKSNSFCYYYRLNCLDSFSSEHLGPDIFISSTRWQSNMLGSFSNPGKGLEKFLEFFVLSSNLTSLSPFIQDLDM